ncbi:MAG: hypothetical protein ACRCXE_01690 [Metamycoplasmataceae bacterium]
MKKLILGLGIEAIGLTLNMYMYSGTQWVKIDKRFFDTDKYDNYKLKEQLMKLVFE